MTEPIKVMALDVGVSTGVAIATIFPKGVQNYLRNLPVIEATALMLDCDFVPSYGVMRLAETCRKHSGIQLIVVEWPFYPANYIPSADFVEMVSSWKSLIGTTFEGITVRTVTPSEWKSSPSKKVSGVLKSIPTAQEIVKPISKHEIDAIRIIHWAGNFSNFPEFARQGQK